MEKLNDTSIAAVFQKPSLPQKMQAYIAFNEYDARYCDSTHALPCKGLTPSGKYVPLRDTQEKALQNAMDKRHTATNLMMAKQSTVWYILEMTFSVNKALHFFQERSLIRMEEGWRFYGDLRLSEAESLEWIQCTIPPTGMMIWACQALKSKEYSLCGNCIGCGATAVPVWYSSKICNSFCCHCWHSSLMESALTGIYVPALDADMRSEDEQMQA